MGDLAAFSFYPGKNLGAYGEGGLVATNNDEFARQVRMLRDWGAERRYHNVLKGYNYRMDGIQGAVLRVKLRYLEQWTEAKRAHAASYCRLLAGSAVTPPRASADARHVFCVYVVRVPDRDAVTARLQAEKIGFGIHYPVPIHLMEAHADLGHKGGDFPVAEQMAGEVLSLPLFPEMTAEQIKRVCAAVTPG